MSFTIRPTQLFLLLALPCTVDAQLVQGRVLEADTNLPIRLAEVVLLNDRDRLWAEGVTDSTGAFRIRVWSAGKYRLQATALGYNAVLSETLEIGAGETFELAVRMTRDAIPLNAITVVARSRRSLADIALRGYYDRRAAGRRIGMGRFLDRREVHGKGGTKLTDVLRGVAGLRVIAAYGGVTVVVSGNPGAGGLQPRCPVKFYLDGMPLPTDGDIDHMVPMEWVEAIEIYRRPAEMPAEFLNDGACGAVGIWTRRGGGLHEGRQEREFQEQTWSVADRTADLLVAKLHSCFSLRQPAPEKCGTIHDITRTTQ